MVSIITTQGVSTMSEFRIHDQDSAPADSRPLLEASQKTYGMIPNLHGVLAESPQALKAYQDLHELVLNTSLDDTETNVVWLTINVEHGCHYCVPAHTAIAHSIKVDPAVIEALREEKPLEESRLEALRTFTLALVRERGRVNADELAAFRAAGYGERQVLDILVAVSQKVLSNYLNHIAETPVDAPFEQFAWNPDDAAA
jgi:uncharacterized peroxidase-related enzyme